MVKRIPNKENQNVKTNPSTTSSKMAPGGEKKSKRKGKTSTPLEKTLAKICNDSKK